MTTQENIAIVEKKDRRYGKGIVIALSRRVIKINSMVYRVESETQDNKFYSVIFKDDAPSSCNCKDFEQRKNVCKHQFALMAALVNNTVIDQTNRPVKLSYKNDEYDF